MVDVSNEDLFINKIHGDLIKCELLNDNKYSLFSFVLNCNCNYTCSYCINNSDSAIKIFYKLYNKINKRKIIIKNHDFKYEFNINYLKYFEEIINNINCNGVIVNLLGGEPTLYCNLEELITKFNIIDKIKYIIITTNGSRSINYFNNLLSLSNKLQFDISYHPEFADDEHFIDLINMFDENNFTNYAINILLYDEYYNKIMNFIDIINDMNKKSKIYLTKLCGVKYESDNLFYNLLNNKTSESIYQNLFSLTFQNNYNIQLSESDLLNLINNNLLDFKYMKCNINRNFWTINNDKLLCPCFENTWFNLYNYKEFIKYYNSNEYIICNSRCDMNCTIMNTKWK